MNLLRVGSQLVFYGLMVFLTVYSATMLYVLLRFGRSKILGVVLGLFYLTIMFSLYNAAAINFASLPFPDLHLW